MQSSLEHEIKQLRARSVSISDPAGERALVAAAKRGDEKSFETLVRRHRPRIFSLALRYTRVREDAEAVVQETFLKTFIHLHKFEGKSAFSSWLTRIAINEALMWLRRGRVMREVSLDDAGSNEGNALALDIPDANPDPEAKYLQREGMRILFAAIGQLTPGIRTAIELREFGELTNRETARRMGLSVGAVKGRVFHGRR